MWLIFALMAAIMAAVMAIFAKIGLKSLDSTLATTVRSIIMALFLVITSLFLKKFQGFTISTFSGREWLFIILSGIAGAMSWLFYFSALKMGLAGKVSAIDRLSLVFTIILATIFLGEALGWKTALGALLMVLGAILISLA